MKIVNVMISRVMGGIEQAFLDYNHALLSCQNEVVSVIDKKCAIKEKVATPFVEINFQKYNPLLILELYFKLKRFAPDVIIVHNKKAIPLFKVLSEMLKTKLVGVAHNAKFKRLEKCDAVFSVTKNQIEKMTLQGFKTDNAFVVPNMIEMPEREPAFQPFHKPVVVGTMGRFEPAKGFCDLIEALAILKKQGVSFKGIIGGKNNGDYAEEEQRIFQKVKDLGLENEIEFCGWVSDKATFFKNIDVFVLPSMEESFGMVLLEAALHKKPIVCSDAEGPKEVWANTDAALVFERGNIKMLGNQLENLIRQPKEAQEMVEKAYELVRDKYALQSVAKVLQRALKKVTEAK